MLVFSGLGAAQDTSEALPMPAAGPAPEVEAVELGGPLDARFEPAVGEPVPEQSDQPPLYDIPPAPMRSSPLHDGADQPSLRGPGAPVIHDLRTGETTVGPEAGVFWENSADGGQGGYYAGVDGGPGEGEGAPASFGIKQLRTDVGNAPWRMNVKVVFSFNNGVSWFVCSGAMRDIRTVQTAGHCIHEGAGGSFATDVLVYPGWDGVGATVPFNPDLDTYGAARGQVLGSATGWTGSGDFDFDWGFVELDRAVGALTGWYGWEWGTACPTGTYNVGAYPAESCPTPGLHNGRDMYYWFGTIDSCHAGTNQLHIDTGDQCLTALWGGESGSNIYRIDGSSRFTRGIASTSNRSTYGHYVETTETWVVDIMNDNFIPNFGRGPIFDLQALDMNALPTTIRAGTSTTTLNHLGANGTNGTKDAQFDLSVRLSSNDFISSSDTLLSNQFYSFNYGAASSVRINMVQVQIPENTAPGTYWLGVLYDSATDGDSINNDSSDWDAQQITVTVETNPPSPNPTTWASVPFELNTSQISMVATTASDPVGPIQYNFDFTSSPTGGGGGSDSAWQASTTYTDSGLGANHDYCYRARARDGSLNMTGYSTTSCDHTEANAPAAAAFSNITQTSIQTNWTANGNPAGTEYFAENITAGTNSGWTTSTSWNSTGLSPDTSYAFRVRARNGNSVVTAWTDLGSATTDPLVGPVVTVSLTPDSTSVPRGGILGYTVKATNNTAVTQCFDYWSNVTLPNESKYPPAGELFGPVNVCLTASQTRSQHLTHGIPGAAPLGSYTYNGFIGPYPTVTDSDHFGFTVTAGPAGARAGWELIEGGFDR